jgi:transposase
LAGVVVERVERSADGVHIAARPRSATAVCPACGAASSRVHSRYQRTLADVAVGQRVVIRLRVRRFFCRQVACPTVTFAEQLSGLTQRYGRHTIMLRGVLRRDHQAVSNGLTLPYSSGPVEGNINRIKMLKRQMYGRAGFALLRKRVLLAV